jgi:membrane-associated phospholipid phosphatase
MQALRSLRNLPRYYEIPAQAALFAVAVWVLRGIGDYDGWELPSWLMVAFGLVGVWREWPDRAERLRELVLGVGLFVLLYEIYLRAPGMWFSIAYYLNRAGNHIFKWNDAMRAIPFNDGAFIWKHRTPWLDPSMKWIYNACFDLVAWVPIIRSLASYNFKKMIHYGLAAHVLQFPLILPFYSTVRIDEVWYVLGHPDPSQRGWSAEVARDVAANCFPSMHTSVAIGIMLMALREKNPIFRWGMATYCVLIVFSTLYMEVHWVVDIVAGIALGIVAVRLADWVMRRLNLSGQRADIHTATL